jgi:hypothetical protein
VAATPERSGSASSRAAVQNTPPTCTTKSKGMAHR